MKLCECGCGELAPIAPQSDRRRGWVKGQPKRFINGHNSRMEGNANWNSGRRIGRQGYVRIALAPHVWAYEHRIVIEAKLGRSLRDGEEVHHIDRDRLNNDPENLLVVTRAQHMRLHAHERRREFCKRGHPLSGNNLRLDRKGNSICRTCNIDRCRRWKEARRSAGAL